MAITPGLRVNLTSGLHPHQEHTMEPDMSRIMNFGDPEVDAISEVYAIIQQLEYGQQRRIVDWLSSRIETDQIPKMMGATGPDDA